MRIAGLTVSVDYADYLEQSLPLWARSLDSHLVVTTARDEATLAVCRNLNVPVHVTDVFYREGAVFNKAGALEEGLAILNPDSWMLLVDADVIPPEDWREQIERAGVESGYLYGVKRVQSDGTPVRDSEALVPGYFNLFHMGDPAVHDRPLFGHWNNASSYDIMFSRRWPSSHWRWLPPTVTHLSTVGRNWCGRGNTEAMFRMRTQRLRLRTWEHERLPD